MSCAELPAVVNFEAYLVCFFLIFSDTNTLGGAAIPTIADGAGNFITAPQTLTFAGGDSLSIIYSTLGSSPLLLIDLVPSDTTFAPSIAKRHFQANKMHKTLRRAEPVPPVIVGSLSRESYAYRNSPAEADNACEFQLPVFVSGASKKSG